ncbi:hypothetical protein Tco_0397835 [Tanacetum coccineum]
MGDKNPIRTLGDYSKPSHEGYRNTIELPVGNKMVPLRSDTIRLVQNGCSFHGLQSEDPIQHLKDFLKLVDSLDLNSENRERTRLRLFQFSLRDQATISLLISFHREGLQNSAMTSWCSNNIMENLYRKHGLVSRIYSKKSLIMASSFGSNGLHDTQYCMEDPEQAFVEYASSRAPPSDTVKNLKLSTSAVLSARSYLTISFLMLISTLHLNQGYQGTFQEGKHFPNKLAATRDGNRNATTGITLTNS